MSNNKRGFWIVSATLLSLILFAMTLLHYTTSKPNVAPPTSTYQDIANSVANAAAYAPYDDTNAAYEAAQKAQAVKDNKLIFCQVIGKRIRNIDCEDLNELMNATKEGIGDISAPERMKVGKPYQIGLKLSFEEQAPLETLNSEGERIVKLNKKIVATVGYQMKAELSGSNFEIKPLHNSIQDLGNHGSAYWEWNVTPKSTGIQNLTLITAVVAKIDNKEPVILKPTIKTIQIPVDVNYTKAFVALIDIAPNGIGLVEKIVISFTALVLAFLGLKTAINRFRNKNPKDKEEEDQNNPEKEE